MSKLVIQNGVVTITPGADGGQGYTLGRLRADVALPPGELKKINREVLAPLSGTPGAGKARLAAARKVLSPYLATPKPWNRK